MPLVINALAVSWGIAGMAVSNQRLLHETESRPITSTVRQLWVYWHVARYPEADPVCWAVSERGGGGQGDAHKVCGLGKSMLLVGDYLVWDGDLHVVIVEAGVGELARQCAPQYMSLMIDD